MQIITRSIFTLFLLVCSLRVSVASELYNAAPYSPSLKGEVNEHQDKIITAGGSITEILFALGLSDHPKAKIIATDSSSTFPDAAKALPKVGYYRQLSVEGVLSVQANRLFALKGAGPANVMQQLQQSGVDVSWFEPPKTVDGLLQLIQQLGEQADAKQAATQLIASIQQQLDKLGQVRHRIDPHKGSTMVFLMSASERGLMAAGGNTVPNLIMRLAGVDNPYAKMQGFKPISVESFLATSPSHVLIASHTTKGQSVQALCEQPALALWAASQGCNVVLVDSLLFLGLTPRLPSAVENVMAITGSHKHAELL